MIQLRDNQVEPIKIAVDFYKSAKPKPSLMVLPTAWGKSILTAFVAKECNDKLLVLQPSKELLEQNYLKYITICGDDIFTEAGIYSASFGKRQIEKITYATIGSIKNIGSTFRELGYTKLLIDEAHLYPREADSMLGKFLKDSEITHVLGITATPVKLQTNSTLKDGAISKLVMLTSRSKKGNFYKDILHVSQISEMVELGFWSPLIYKQMAFNNSSLIYNSSKSEFTEDSVNKAFDENNLHDKIFNVLDRAVSRKSILVFVPSVDEAISLSNIYPDSAPIYGLQDASEREQNIERFKAGEIRVIFNVRVLSVGFDHPQLDMILLASSFANIATYYQIVGRVTRIHNSKSNSVVYDLAGNIDRFGRVEDIVIKKGTMWRMFGTNGRLLTGVPISEIGNYTEAMVEQMDNEIIEKRALRKQGVIFMPFGKHKGSDITKLPLHYIRWLLTEYTWDKKYDYIKTAIEKL